MHNGNVIKERNAGIGLLGLVGSSLLFSTGFASRAVAGLPGTSVSVSAWRIFIGGAGIAIYVAYKYGWGKITQLTKMPSVWLVASITLIYQFAMFYAAPKIGVAMTALIAVGANSLLSGVVAWVFGFGRPSKIWVFSTVIAVFGLTLLTGFNGEVVFAGVLAALAAGLISATYVVYNVKIVREKNLDGILVNAVMLSIGAIFAAPIALATGGWISSSKDVLFLIYVGVMATTVANISFGIGMHNLAPATVTSIMLLEPVAATMWGIFLLDEKLTAQGLLGCVIVLSALGLLAYSESKKPTVISEEVGILA